MYSKKVKLRFVFIIIFLALIVLTIFTVLKVLKDNVVYFKSPSEINLLSEISNKKIRSLLRKKVMHFGTVKTNKLSIEMTRKLTHYYQEDIRELSHLLNRDLSHWVKSIDRPD